MLEEEYKVESGDKVTLLFGIESEPQGRFSVLFNDIEIGSGKTMDTVSFSVKVFNREKKRNFKIVISKREEKN